MRRTQLSTAIRLPATGGLALCLLLGGISLTACTGSIPVDGNRAEEVEKADETADTEECSEEESQARSSRSSAWDASTKPVIYLYPDETTDVTVSVEHPERLTCTYPETDGSWSVVAESDGTLTDESTGRKLYALYYEVEVPAGQVGDEGFVVERDGIVPFLEEKLATLGLTEREAEEMIVYWLPRMQEHDRCYVRFSMTDEE